MRVVKLIDVFFNKVFYFKYLLEMICLVVVLSYFVIKVFKWCISCDVGCCLSIKIYSLLKF